MAAVPVRTSHWGGTRRAKYNHLFSSHNQRVEQLKRADSTRKLVFLWFPPTCVLGWLYLCLILLLCVYGIYTHTHSWSETSSRLLTLNTLRCAPSAVVLVGYWWASYQMKRSPAIKSCLMIMEARREWFCNVQLRLSVKEGKTKKQKKIPKHGINPCLVNAKAKIRNRMTSRKKRNAKRESLAGHRSRPTAFPLFAAKVS